jgi:hypothetical protein
VRFKGDSGQLQNPDIGRTFHLDGKILSNGEKNFSKWTGKFFQTADARFFQICHDRITNVSSISAGST